MSKQTKPESDEETLSSKVEKKETSKRGSTSSQRETRTTKSQSKQGRRSRNVAQPVQEDGSKQATEDDTEGCF